MVTEEEAMRIQYTKLSSDWTHFNTIIWGVPTVAIAIMIGILIGAYQNLGNWPLPRIISLSIGSLFLFALTIEVVKKRFHMNVISLLIKDLQVKLGLSEELRFPLGISNDINKYLETRLKNEKGQLADYNDPLFKFFERSYARQYLTYVIFSAAIILAILAEWEFVNNRMIGGNYGGTLLVGIMVGISAIIAPIIWYVHDKQQEEQKKKQISHIKSDNKAELSVIFALPEKLPRGKKQKVTITAIDVKSNEHIPGAIIRGKIDYNPSNNNKSELAAELEEDVTDSTGQCSYTWTLDESWEDGNYTLKIAVSAKGYKTNVIPKNFKVGTLKYPSSPIRLMSNH